MTLGDPSDTKIFEQNPTDNSLILEDAELRLSSSFVDFFQAEVIFDPEMVD